MIKGLELAGPNPTRASVIHDLRGVTSYNANGLLPQPLDYRHQLRARPARSCAWIMKAETDGVFPSSKTSCRRRDSCGRPDPTPRHVTKGRAVRADGSPDDAVRGATVAAQSESPRQ